MKAFAGTKSLIGVHMSTCFGYCLRWASVLGAIVLIKTHTCNSKNRITIQKIVSHNIALYNMYAHRIPFSFSPSKHTFLYSVCYMLNSDFLFCFFFVSFARRKCRAKMYVCMHVMCVVHDSMAFDSLYFERKPNVWPAKMICKQK